MDGDGGSTRASHNGLPLAYCMSGWTSPRHSAKSGIPALAVSAFQVHYPKLYEAFKGPGYEFRMAQIRRFAQAHPPTRRDKKRGDIEDEYG